MLPIVFSGLFILAAVCALAWLWSRVSMYRKLFAEAHFVQFGEKIGAVKQAALSNLGCEDVRSPGDDPRWFRTDAGLVLLYTISNDSPGKYVHYASVSVAGTYTAHGVGETFILLWARLLGIEYERLALGISKATVHHATFVLEEAEQTDFARRQVEALTIEKLRDFYNEKSKVRERLTWNHFDVARQTGGSERTT
jgi:hypothetical protein